MYICVFLLSLATLIGCSSAKELEGHWTHTKSREVDPWEVVSPTLPLPTPSMGSDDVDEYMITSKTVTYSFVYGGKIVSTKPYKVFEKGQSYIVLEIGQESKQVLTESKKLLRFDLISEDKILVNGKVFIRVK